MQLRVFETDQTLQTTQQQVHKFEVECIGLQEERIQLREQIKKYTVEKRNAEQMLQIAQQQLEEYTAKNRNLEQRIQEMNQGFRGFVNQAFQRDRDAKRRP